MVQCSNCEFWLYRYPNRLGVCTVAPKDPVGTIQPVTEDAVGMILGIEYESSTATSADTICDEWQPLQSNEEAWDD